MNAVLFSMNISLFLRIFFADSRRELAKKTLPVTRNVIYAMYETVPKITRDLPVTLIVLAFNSIFVPGVRGFSATVL